MDELDLDPLAAVGAKVGYARVSTAGQLLDRQLTSLVSAGCIRVFADKVESTRFMPPPRRIAALTCGGMGSGVVSVALEDGNRV